MSPRTALLSALALLCLVPVPGAAQEPLSLREAIGRALATHPSVRAAEAGQREARARVQQARGGWLPRVDLTEGWMRGDQPVFVFGSLLNQRRFTEANFAIEALNRPDPVSNHRLGVVVQQTVFDGFAIQSALRQARVGAEAAEQQRLVVSQDLAVAVTQSFGAVLRAEAERQAAASAVEAAEEDLRRVRHRQEAGFVTTADVLAVQVSLAELRAALVAAEGNLALARSRLNELIGAPLDAVFSLTLEPTPTTPPSDAGALETEALETRADLRLAALQVEGARAGLSLARAALIPQAGAFWTWELNGGSFADRQSNWMAGVELRVNLFRGGSDLARVAEARAAVTRQEELRRRVEQQVRLEVRQARIQLESALARAEVAREALARARESQRIVRDRYEAGLEDVTSLLRAAQAVRQAEALEVSTRVDITVAATSLDRALGRVPR